jgi:CubicO group peptidase (beta-lactamase class C family)
MKTILRISLITLFCLALFGNTHPILAGTIKYDFAPVDAYMAETMQRLPIKGMALAIVKGDQTIYMNGYGIANAQGDPATPQTPWLMGSVTKSVTALAVQQLIAQGKLSLHTRIQTILPEFHLAETNQAAAPPADIHELV